jgi:hypothetical protein
LNIISAMRNYVLCVLFAVAGMLASAPAVAQLAVEPGVVRVVAPQYGSETRGLTLTNDAAEPLAFCLSFARPLEEDGGGGLRLAAEAVGGGPEGAGPCPPYGEVFARFDEEELPGPTGWYPYGLAVAPDGRVFVSDNGSNDRTHELTPALEFVRFFVHPTVGELATFPFTNGVAYRTGGPDGMGGSTAAGGPDLDPGPDHGALWWLNAEDSGFNRERVLLLEGDLDGTPTGRRIQLPVAEEAPPPSENGAPVGLAFDGAAARFYFLDFVNRDFWAVDTLGQTAPGYPLEQQAYAGAFLSQGLDAHRGVDYRGVGAENPAPPEGAEDEGLWLEVGVLLEGSDRYSRVVALAAADGSWPGADTDAPGAPGVETAGIETAIPVFAGGEGLRGEPARSRADPNGALYYAVSTFGIEAVVGVHPHPLPPSWLLVGTPLAGQLEGSTEETPWRGVLAPGESREVALVFRPGARAGGTYRAALQAFAASGEAVEVELELEVVPGTSAEEDDAVGTDGALALTVHPNPSAGAATVTLTLAAPGDVHVEVFDVLGREVAVLHEGSLGAGAHRLRLDTASLPTGVYVVRAVAGGERITRKLVVAR